MNKLKDWEKLLKKEEERSQTMGVDVYVITALRNIDKFVRRLIGN